MTNQHKDITSYNLTRKPPYEQLMNYVAIHCLIEHFFNGTVWEIMDVRRTVEAFIKETANAQ